MKSSWKRFHQPRFILFYPLGACFLLVGHVTEVTLRSGIALIIVGEAIRCWANGTIGQAKVNRGGSGRLITAGPYAFVRHPLYLGTFLIGSGFAFVIGNLWLGLAAAGCFIAAYRSKIAQEEKLLGEECGPEYSLYRASVPALVPMGFPYRRRLGRWSWSGVLASKEWKTVFWLIIFVILLYFWEETVQEREWFLDERFAFRLSLLILVLVIAIADGIFQLTQSRFKNGSHPSPRS
ncbi:MAG: isoprenylcysteine carboxylmethyltransferase family protein [Candidatus Omnitrophota bacterium]|nr:isoprenylcysteine carboxylmethyltransferase family protein [Candidatus Omnitrophota bacterium]